MMNKIWSYVKSFLKGNLIRLWISDFAFWIGNWGIGVCGPKNLWFRFFNSFSKWVEPTVIFKIGTGKDKHFSDFASFMASLPDEKIHEPWTKVVGEFCNKDNLIFSGLDINIMKLYIDL